MLKKQDQQIKKRPRPYQLSHRWTQFETNSMLELVVVAVKDNPESYEKPTAHRFFQRLAEISPQLASIDWICMKSKMRYLKGTYMSPLDWKGKTGAGLLETGEEKSVQKICPFFDELEQYLGLRKIEYQTSCINQTTPLMISSRKSQRRTQINMKRKTTITPMKTQNVSRRTSSRSIASKQSQRLVPFLPFCPGI
ncbi:uncharacterized protein LOC129945127 [Eupeodes corollae]|uniref:uncharacterized protein LOC129945127 n=1 Tax=Eupeodes corollae TaxID=290404 RepID=UPI00248FB66A|nr:uncharacterized protein LOC129945127 [Eupeodes corollae]